MLMSAATKGAALRTHGRDLPRTKDALRLCDGAALQHGRVHEIMGNASDAFACMIGGLTNGPVIWIGRRHDVTSLSPIALANFFDPARLILTEGSSRDELLWAGEQAMRAKGGGLVICQTDVGPDLKESRRLQLAAEQGGAIGLVLVARAAQSSAAQTRWRCEATVACNNPYHDEWVFSLIKNKNGQTGEWRASWRADELRGEDAQGALHMAAVAAA